MVCYLLSQCYSSLSLSTPKTGGMVTINLLHTLDKEVLDRLRGIAFTDSVHSLRRALSKHAKEFLAKNSCNWVQSRSKLDTVVEKVSDAQGCRCVSAGVDVHEHTSEACRESAIAYLAKRVHG
jgi:hypothetical protein